LFGVGCSTVCVADVVWSSGRGSTGNLVVEDGFPEQAERIAIGSNSLMARCYHAR